MALLRYVDTVQKLTNILVLNGGGLLDLGAGQRHLGDVNAGELDLILDVVGTGVLNTVEEVDSSHSLLTQKVADLHSLLAAGGNVGHVDGKVSIAESHLVLVALGHASEHVVDVGRHGSKITHIARLAYMLRKVV